MEFYILDFENGDNRCMQHEYRSKPCVSCTSTT